MQAASAIAKWYKGKGIFVTGATGFMGKVLIEKLLRSCRDVGPIYVLVRNKKNTTSRDRLEKLISSSTFETVRATRSNLSSGDWIVPIAGDLSLPELGISAEDRRRLQENVSVVFHVAATVSFIEPLPVATAINITGTRAVLELCQGMTNLAAVVHVSTVYANCTQPVLEERVFPPPVDLNVIANSVSSSNDHLLEPILQRLLGDYPNTYTLTKTVAEHVVAEYSSKLPVIIVRPSIVWSSWREPEPGWGDSLNGAGIFAFVIAKGLLKTFYGKRENVIDIVPVDMCINLIIAAAWEMGTIDGTGPSPDPLVYNYVSGPLKPVTWDRFVASMNDYSEKYASNDIFMTPGCNITRNKIKHDLTKALFQTLPAAVVDYIVLLSGGKPRYLQTQITNLSPTWSFVALRDWDFRFSNVQRLKRKLSPIDREIFDFDVTNIDWTKYFDTSFLGLRRHVMNEKDETIPAAAKKLATRIRWKRIFQSAVFITIPLVVLESYDVSVGTTVVTFFAEVVK